MGWLNIYMPRFPVRVVKQYSTVFLCEESRPLLWEFKKSLGKDKLERLKKMNKNRELNISYDTWFENMLHDTSERPSFLL